MRITEEQRDRLVELAGLALPREACGLLAGTADTASVEGAVREVMPLTNVEHNPVGCGWRADSREQFRAFQRIDDEGWELLAIYHSHPRSDAYPSDRDIEHALFPDALYVIVSLAEPGSPDVRGFRIAEGTASEEAIVVETSEAGAARSAEVS